MERKLIKKFCFTLNNYTEDEFTAIRNYATTVASFAIIGREVGENKTPHLQGYMNLKKQSRFPTIKKVMPRAHLEIAQGTDQDNYIYCSKQDKEPFIVGEPQVAGKRKDLDLFKKAAQEGLTYDEALEAHSEVVARYPRFVREYTDKVARDKLPQLEIKEYRPWQQDIMNILSQPPHDRQIHWVYDVVGGTGKTYLAKHLVSMHDAFYTNGGKATDIFYAYRGQRIAIFDFVRETKDFVNYGAIEAIKNGLMSSNKYESTMKVYATPHVIVFANFRPAEGKLSADRINLIVL